MLPSQANLLESNLACDAAPPSSGSIATPRPTMAIFGAVLRRGIEEIVGKVERARTRPVLWDDDRIARQIFTEVAREQPAIGVIAEAGRREADQNLDLLAGKRDCLRGGGARQQQGRCHHDPKQNARARPTAHALLRSLRQPQAIEMS